MVIRGVADSMPMKSPSRFRGRDEEILYGKMEGVEVARHRLDARNGAGEPAVLGIIRVRDHLDGLDNIDGQAHRGIAGCRISHVRTID